MARAPNHAANSGLAARLPLLPEPFCLSAWSVEVVQPEEASGCKGGRQDLPHGLREQEAAVAQFNTAISDGIRDQSRHSTSPLERWISFSDRAAHWNVVRGGRFFLP